MKKVFNTSDQVIHLFAQRTQDEARCTNVYFDDRDKIYSYGSHYLLGEFLDDNTIMINDRSYSVTTAKHIREISYATRQYKQYFTTKTDSHLVLNQLKDLADKLVKARKPGMYIGEAENLYKKYITYCEERGVAKNAEIEEIYKIFVNDDAKATYKNYLTTEAQKIAEANKVREERAKCKFVVDLKKFLEYRINYIYNNPTGEDYLRISQDGLRVETSQNVEVPIEEARSLYKLIKKGVDVKGHKIHNYTVISMNGVLKIGCHHINKHSVQNIGEKIIN